MAVIKIVNSGQILLTEKTKEELIEIILQKEKRIQELEKKLLEKEKVEAQKKFLKMQRLLAKAKHPKTPGQKAGHPGLTRIKPKSFDRIVEETLTHCPDCQHRLSESQEVIEHIQEDIIPAHPQVTLFLEFGTFQVTNDNKFLK